MDRNSLPKVKDLVLLGGGHTHALVLRKWGMKPVKGVRVTLINPDATAPYTGMLPGHVAGHYGRDSLDIDLVRLARFAGARLIIGSASGIDRAAKTVSVPGRASVAYDLLSIDIGITSDLPGLPGFADHGVAAKPLDRFAAAWRGFVERLDGHPHTPNVTVLGGGVAGVELALAMAHRLKTAGKPGRITILESLTALRGISQLAREPLLQALADETIDLREGVTAESLSAEGVTLSNGGYIAADFVVGAAGARPHDWLAETGLALTNGFITVNEDLRVRNDPAIFAAGDCAHFAPAPRPKAGVFAVRAAPVLYANLKAVLTDWPTRPFKPQRDYLKLISLGRRSALAEKHRLAVQGTWLWRLKDWIDRGFMDKLTDLPAMDPPPLPSGKDVASGVRAAMGDGQPLCGGCGAKVGPDDLSAALTSLPVPGRSDIEIGPGDDAAILRLGDKRQVLTTDHLRTFTEDPWLMGQITALHAMGDVWAMGATPQAALASIILPPLDPTLQRRTLAEILDGVRHALDEAGAALVGGHSTQGAELTVGITLTGLAPETPIFTSGARPGDVLILTKPLGSGIILAAEMAMEAKGPWVRACLDHLVRGQGEAATHLTPFAHAMTDVTGFGLLGHLKSMMAAAGTEATLNLDTIPLMEGAPELNQRGIRSTLYPQNRRQAESFDLPLDPRIPLLFDPQTSGGLLAAVPATVAEKCLAALRQSGYPAARIGEVGAAGSGALIAVR